MQSSERANPKEQLHNAPETAGEVPPDSLRGEQKPAGYKDERK